MNNIFSFKRFGLLFTKEIKEYFQKFGTFTLAILCAYILYWFFTLIQGGTQSFIANRIPVIFIFIFAYIFLIPFHLYGESNHPNRGINYALLPASTCEKYCSMLLCTTIICPLVFSFVMLGLDTLLSLLSMGKVFTGNVFSTNIFDWKFLGKYVMMLLFQSLSIYGNLLFKKHKISRTFLCLIGVLTVLMTISIITLLSIYPDGQTLLINNNKLMFGDSTLFENWVQSANVIAQIFKYLCLIGIPVLLYVLSFFRLKNLQYK